ncbi:tyrosine-type recombinase/integrase [Clostridium sp. ZBS18]|uniref:tyrosine-type recombinase/integrase n=1 Tax=Clostridium sp. ZBS18 TaxID=2949967 RepID=UPI00207A0DD5|nr:tyrosine-type recombinase/integrase [Clostridium sp. ZBS18]
MRKKINLPESVLEFNDYLLNIKGKSIKTVNGYNLDLKMFFSFYKLYKEKKSTDDISNVNITKISIEDIQKITLDDLYSFIDFLVKKKNCANTRNRKIATLKSYFRFLLKKKYIQENIAEDLETAKIPKKEVLAPTPNEVEKIFNSLNKDSKFYIRNKAMLSVLAYAGLRVEECSNLTLNDVDLVNEQVIVRDGKGNKDRIIYMSNSLLDSLNEYFDTIDNKDKFLWIGEHGKKLSKETIMSIVKTAIINAGLKDKGYTTHSLRKYFATEFYKASGYNILLTSEMLGHSSIETTRKYLKVNENDIRKIMINM